MIGSTEDGDVLLSLYVNPVPASRPRVPRFGKPYYGKKYTAWRKSAEEAFPAAASPMEGPLHVYCRFAVQKPKTTKRFCPLGDIDNYEKAIFDAVTRAGYWHDDDQIVYLVSEKRFADPNEAPHTLIHIKKEG